MYNEEGARLLFKALSYSQYEADILRSDYTVEELIEGAEKISNPKCYTRLKDIIETRFGLASDGKLATYREMSKKYGISAGRMSQLVHRYLHRMRNYIGMSHLFIKKEQK